MSYARLSVVALLDEVGHLAQGHELVAYNLIVLVESHSGDIALSHLEIADAFVSCAVHCADLRTKSLAEILEACADVKSVVRESGLRAAVDYLEEQLAHSGVDSVADEVGVQSLKNGLAGEDLSLP